MTGGRRTLLALAPIVALAACQQADVGQACTIVLSPGQTAPSPTTLWFGPAGSQCASPPCGGEWVEFNNTECDNLVCINSPVPPESPYAQRGAQGYCSKPCVSNRDCFESSTKLVCRNIILDDTFLRELDLTDPATKARYLGEIQYSNYCGVP